jgi:hypothetical protein
VLSTILTDTRDQQLFEWYRRYCRAPRMTDVCFLSPVSSPRLSRNKKRILYLWFLHVMALCVWSVIIWLPGNLGNEITSTWKKPYNFSQINVCTEWLDKRQGTQTPSISENFFLLFFLYRRISNRNNNRSCASAIFISFSFFSNICHQNCSFIFPFPWIFVFIVNSRS